MSTTSHPEETAEENVFHPDFNQADANIIIESNDGRKFRIHDYFLKANSPVFRDMLSLSTGLKDNVVPLPEAGEDIAALLKVISGTAGDVNASKFDLKKSFRLLKLARKYDIAGTPQFWIESLVEACTKKDPLEGFAMACESTPMEAQLAKRAIMLFPSSPVPDVYLEQRIPSGTMGRRDGRLDLTVYPEYARETDPAYWSPEYVQRLALVNYNRYVRAWSRVYVQPYVSTQSRSSQKALEELASTFYSFLMQ